MRAFIWSHSLVFACFIVSAATTAPCKAEQTAGQQCGTVFECAKLAVEKAAEAGRSLDEAKTVIGTLRAQLNTYEARLAKDEEAERADKKEIEELRNALSATKWGDKKDSVPLQGKIGFPDIQPNTVICDPGYYVVGASAWASNARLGGGNIYQLQLTCRKLNLP
jgi:hypothetical protein